MPVGVPVSAPEFLGVDDDAVGPSLKRLREAVLAAGVLGHQAHEHAVRAAGGDVLLLACWRDEASVAVAFDRRHEAGVVGIEDGGYGFGPVHTGEEVLRAASGPGED